MQLQGNGSNFAPSQLEKMEHVAKLSLFIGFFCALGILLLALYLDTPNSDYLRSISSLVTSSERLDLLMLLTACCLVGACAAVTWSISVYNSHHIAGPLFRFSKNLQLDEDGNPPQLIRIRDTDYLHSEHDMLCDSLNHFYAQYTLIEQQLICLRETIPGGDEELVQAQVDRVQDLIRAAALDD